MVHFRLFTAGRLGECFYEWRRFIYLLKRESGRFQRLVYKFTDLEPTTNTQNRLLLFLDSTFIPTLNQTITVFMDSDMIRLYLRYVHEPDHMISLDVPSDILVDDLRPIVHDTEGLECSISQVILFSPDGDHIDHDATVNELLSDVYDSQTSTEMEPLFIKILDPDEMADHGDNMWKMSSRINKLHIK